MPEPTHPISKEAHDAVIAALRGATTPWPDGALETDIAGVIRISEEQGIQPLLRHNLKAARIWDSWPQPLRAAIEDRAVKDALMAELWRGEARRVLDALGEEGIPVLVLKGAALANSIYPNAGLRPSCDVDLLFRREDIDRMRPVLAGLGFELYAAYSYQETHTRKMGPVVRYNLDCHWAITDREMLSRDFDFDEIAACSVPVPALGPHARTLGTTDALLLACMHVAHHLAWDRAIWLYDVHLLASTLDANGFDHFARRAREKRVSRVCARVLALAREYFDTPALGDATAIASGSSLWIGLLGEPSSVLLLDDRPVLRDHLLRLFVAHGWRAKVRVVAELALPSRSSLETRYGHHSRVLRPVVYTYHWGRGILKYYIGRSH